MSHLHLDFETRSKANIDFGYDLYARNAEVLMLAYALDDRDVHLWVPSENGATMPLPLEYALADPSVIKVAWNSAFERAIFLHCLGLDIPRENWLDPKFMARYAGMPAHLSDVSRILNLGDDGKDKEGKRLIKLFCVPNKKGVFNQPKDHPEDWELFKAYAKQDVVAERTALRELSKAYSLPPRENKIAILDWKINERGMPVDLKFVTQKNIEVIAEKARLMEKFKAHTGLENPNSVTQLLPWLNARGYKFNSLGEAKVRAALSNGCTAEVKRALELRLATSRSSTSKLTAALARTSADSRVRYCYTYYGAHTGRWSGQGVQPQNLPRNVVSIGEVEADMRAIFKAPAGTVLSVSDLSQIEVRVNAWLAGCETLLDIFRRIDEGEECDVYKDFAANTMYQIPYDQVTKQMRQIAKSAVLGAGFGCGPGDLLFSCCGQPVAKGHTERCEQDGDEVKTGLWGYAHNMGIDMSKEDAKQAVYAFRDGYWEIPQLWKNLEYAAYQCVLNPGKWIDGGDLKFVARKERMVIELPTGRRLYYRNPRVVQGEWPDGRPKQMLTYDGKYHREATYGGKLCENVVQAIARDVIAEGMLRADARGLDIVGHTHDEVICEGAVLEQLNECLTEPMPWAPGIPLAADGYEAEVYKK